ncbi:MAG: ABC transporter ATP-binding protein [Synechococcales cyanobacterium]
MSEAVNQEWAVTTEGLSKIYRTGFWLNKQVRSLNRCSLRVRRGETFGLLGPNGAGKTTTIKCLLGISQPSEGQGTILGRPLGDRHVKQQIGYLPENAYFYDQLTAWEFLEMAGSLFKLPQSVIKERIPQLLEQVGLSLETARKKALKTYSKGMLQRTGVAQALINDPALVFLDEPMSGLDPLGRYHMRELIRHLKQEGKTVFFNTHILSDVEAICDRVAILVKGNLVAAGSLDELLGNSEDFQVQGQGGDVASILAQLTHGQQEGERWQGRWSGSPAVITQHIVQAGGMLLSLQRQRQSLEDYFVERVRQEDTGVAV